MIVGHFFSYDQIATSESRNHGITFTKCQIVVTTDDHVKHSHKNKEDEDRKNVKFLHTILVTCLTRMRRLSSGLCIFIWRLLESTFSFKAADVTSNVWPLENKLHQHSLSRRRYLVYEYELSHNKTYLSHILFSC